MHNSTLHIKRKHAHFSPFVPSLPPTQPNSHFPNTQKMKESTTSVANTNQPQVVYGMSKSFLHPWYCFAYIIAEVMNVAEDNNQDQQHKQCEHAGYKAWRIRGGGVAKVCSLLLTITPPWLWYNRIASWVRSDVSSVLVRSPFPLNWSSILTNMSK